jgi:hypothetical protein
MGVFFKVCDIKKNSRSLIDFEAPIWYVQRLNPKYFNMARSVTRDRQKSCRDTRIAWRKYLKPLLMVTVQRKGSVLCMVIDHVIKSEN